MKIPTSTSRMARSIASLLLCALVIELVAPAVSMALTSGPAQPEFTGFEPIGTTGMVNEATGTFTYSIPLIQVPGPDGMSYPLTLSYHSGASVEDDASWVGYGWSLNPGAVNRNVRGIPDDLANEETICYNNQPDDETYSVGGVADIQTASYNLFSYERAVTFNNRAGYSLVSGSSLNVGGMVSLDLRSDNGRSRFSVRPNWYGLFSEFFTSVNAVQSEEKVRADNANETPEQLAAALKSNADRAKDNTVASVIASSAAAYITQSFYTAGQPTAPAEFAGTDVFVNFGATASAPIIPYLSGLHLGARGTYSVKTFPTDFGPESPKAKKVRAYGFLYHNNTIADDAMMDYSVQSEGQYGTRDRYLSPVYSGADMFSVNGNGITGTFRFWNRKHGMYRPRKSMSSKIFVKANLELGFSLDKVGLGSVIAFGYDETSVGKAAMLGTPLLSRLHEVHSRVGGSTAFARMTNDQADNVLYYPTDGPQYAWSGSFFSGAYTHVNAASVARPRSSTSVLYRTNNEMVNFLWQRPNTSTSYPPTATKLADRRASYSKGYLTEDVAPGKRSARDRVGEFTLTNPSGQFYVYGLPVYSKDEQSLTYSGKELLKVNQGENFYPYSHFDLEVHNERLRTSRSDARVSGYARAAKYPSTHLLTEVRNADYLDLTGNGPSVDDAGGWVSFSYNKAAGAVEGKPDTDNKKWYRWRSPYSGFHYDKASLSSKIDDRASVSMGYKELYYLNKIETRTHTAIFVTNKTNTSVSTSDGIVTVKGSLEERHDAWEAYNADATHDENEKISAKWDGHESLPAVVPAFSDLGSKYMGGRKSSTRPDLDKIAAHREDVTPNKSQRLEKVMLFSRNQDGTLGSLVQTVNLEYSYELQETRPGFSVDKRVLDPVTNKWVETPDDLQWDSIYGVVGKLNSSIAFTDEGVHTKHLGKKISQRRYGKLSLKKVWTDYGSVKSGRISPYEFEYKYASTPFKSEVTSETMYASLLAYEAQFVNTGVVGTPSTDDIQNQHYDPIYKDAWGAYGSDRWVSAIEQRPHLDQKATPGVWYDPGAWQLKVIRLPSGGEIHVQYEANTYGYVQDQPALAFVRLAPEPNLGAPTEIGGNKVYLLDKGAFPSKLNADGSTSAYTSAEIVDMIKQYLRTYRKRLYYKFLTPVVPNSGYSQSTADFPDGGAEYITAHSDVDESEVRLGAGGEIGIVINDDARPIDLAREYALTHKVGNAGPYDYRPLGDGTYEDESLWSNLLQSFSFVSNSIDDIDDEFDNYGFDMLRPLAKFSYMRVPIGSKRGGGLRVKRIYMYDPGIEEGAAGIYGSEYLYLTKNAAGQTISSGVATTEPAAIRDESALTTYLIGKDDQSFVEKAGAGEDLEQMEGPLCSNAYPSPSIAYSRVVTRPISFSLKSSPGFAVSEFNTAKDYPVRVECTQVNQSNVSLPPIPAASAFVDVNMGTITAEQGYTVYLNAMHGVPKSVKKYAGNYGDPATWRVVESMEYEYRTPGEGVPVVTLDGSGKPCIVNNQRLGVDMDVASEARQIRYSKASAQLPFDVGIKVSVPPVLPPLWIFFATVSTPSVQLADQILETRVLTKIVSSSVMPYRTRITRDGMCHVEEVVAFNISTGQPAITKSYDEMYNVRMGAPAAYNQNALYSYDIPATLYYPMLGAKAANDMISVGCTRLSATQYQVAAGNTMYFDPGDMVRIGRQFGGIMYHVTGKSGTTLTVTPMSWSLTPMGTTNLDTITVVQSGRKNQLDLSAGSVRQYYSGANTSDLFSSMNNVLSAEVTTYSDQWPSATVNAPTAIAPPNDYENGVRGRWAPVSRYIWRSPIQTAGATYETGYRTTGYTVFPYASPGSASTSTWIKASTTTRMTPHMQAQEEQDAMGIVSSAQFNWQRNPDFVLKNASNGKYFYNNFESDGSGVTGGHTGLKGRNISTSTLLASLTAAATFSSTGASIKYWVKSNLTTPLTVTFGGVPVVPQRVGRAGEWTLFELNLPAGHPAFIGGDPVQLNVASTSGTVMIDDVRVQPLTAQGTCYVYDMKTARLVAQLDDRHFATIYQYNPEGKLTAKQRETERGTYTVEERKYNTAVRNADEIHTGSPGMLTSPGRGFGGTESIDKRRALPQSRKSGMGADADILDIKLSPKKRSVQVFGKDSLKLPQIDSLKQSLDSIRTNDRNLEKVNK